MNTESIIPQNVDAEKALISTILISPDYLAEIIDQLTAQDFYTRSYQQIWNAVITVFKSGQKVDLVTISSALKTLYKANKPPSSEIVACFENSSYGVNVHAYVKEIKDKAMLRAIIQTAQAHLFEAQVESAEPEKILTALEADIVSILDKNIQKNPIEAVGINKEITANYVLTQKTGWHGFDTGFMKLDELTGGLIPTQNWIIGAYCMGAGTKIVMWDGSKKNVEDIQINDLLAPVDSVHPRIVQEVTSGTDDLFEISGKYINTFVVNQGHLLPMVWVGDGYKKYEKNKQYIFTISEFIKKSARERRGFRLIKKQAVYAENNTELLIPPYLLGLWLGDGNRTRAVFSVSKNELVLLKYLRTYASEVGLNYSEIDYKNDGVLTVAISEKNGGDYRQRKNNLFCKLKHYSLIGNKHIPHEYMCASVKERLELLAGLIDTDGSLSGVNNKVINFSNVDEKLIKQVQELCESLGLNTNLRKWKQKQSSLIKKWKEFYIYRLSITGNIHLIPIKLDRKKPEETLSKKNNLTFSVKYIGRGKYYGFLLDGNHLYLAQNNIVNHNTGGGKSFFILQVLLNVLRSGAKIALFSTEMDRKINMLRLIGNIAGLGVVRMLRGGLLDHELDAMKEAQAELAGFGDRLIIYDNVYHLEEIRLKSKKLKLTNDLNVIAVDFIQNLRGGGSIYDRMGEAAVGLQQLGQELSTTQLIGSQVSNTSAGWQSKEAIEYKGAGEIAAIADVGIWIQKDKNAFDERNILLRKVRHGSVGKFKVKFEFPGGRFIDLASEEAEAQANESIQTQLLDY
jgi:replicative DNA helicase